MIETLTGLRLAYSFLSETYLLAPRRSWVEQLAEDALFEDFPLEPRNEGLAEGLARLQAFVGEAKAVGYDEATTKIDRDYSALFIGPGHLLAPPWESVFRDEEHLLFGEVTFDVRGWYRRYGLQVRNLHREPDDHIGLEFAFLAHLSTLALERLAADDGAGALELCDAQGQFLRDHLALWGPSLAASIVEHASTDYFRGIGHLTHGVIVEADEQTHALTGVSRW